MNEAKVVETLTKLEKDVDKTNFALQHVSESIEKLTNTVAKVAGLMTSQQILEERMEACKEQTNAKINLLNKKVEEILADDKVTHENQIKNTLIIKGALTVATIALMSMFSALVYLITR